MPPTHEEIIYDHYKDTFSNIRSRERHRNNIFYLFYTSVAIVGIIAWDSEILGKISEASKDSHLVIIDAIPKELISTIAWAISTYLFVKYLSIQNNIEREYRYLHDVEKEMSNLISTKNFQFSREGDNYKNERKIFSGFSWVVYQFILPILALCVLGTALFNQISGSIEGISLSEIANTVLLFSMFLAYSLYSLQR